LLLLLLLLQLMRLSSAEMAPAGETCWRAYTNECDDFWPITSARRDLLTRHLLAGTGRRRAS